MADREYVRAMFEAADTNKSGKLSSQEVKSLLENQYGTDLSDDVVQHFMAEHDLDGDNEWSIDELAELFAPAH
ncbi:unnamed protein product [Trichobilharzia regenti]|uniref:EF-hand domain-containing protein n=1 Tax=Trichobilharzia regenti TaxID=157069 RepID=A0A183VW85_TRIRE|nr:unnamed protein product [Trichobilharzia regenti]VDQ00621.1 unnamed protein product [Trichobilharzia regenti]